MNLVDTSGWIEYFEAGPNGRHFAQAIENFGKLLVPSICFYEVFKWYVLADRKTDGLERLLFMQRGRSVDLGPELASSAAEISATEKMPMADSIILASARIHRATLWTQDADFKKISGVRYFEKQKAG